MFFVLYSICLFVKCWKKKKISLQKKSLRTVVGGEVRKNFMSNCTLECHE